MKRQINGFCLLVLGAFTIPSMMVFGCGPDDQRVNPTTSASSAGGGSPASSSSSSASSAASTGGGGGAGGSGATCLDPSVAASILTIADPTLCIVAMYDGDDVLSPVQAPAWGRHGGPVIVAPGASGSVDIIRLSPPSGAMGKLTKQTTNVPAMIPVMDTFLGAQALDLPFFNWTAVSWTGKFPDTQGEIILTNGGAIDARYPVNGAFALAGIGAMNGQGRLLYTGLSAIDDAMASENGLYAADSCGMTGSMPRLEPSGDGSCSTPELVAAWGDFSGPVVSDSAGDVFVVAPSFAGTQEARGFASTAIARGAPAATGDVLFSLPGSGVALAALAPKGATKGMLFFQPSDPTTFDPLDAVAQSFTVAAGEVTAEAAPSPVFTLKDAGTPLAFFTDDEERVWVAASGASSTSYVVVSRVP